MHVIAADVALACGDRDRAHAQCDQAFALTDGLDCPDVLATANCTAAKIARLDGHVSQAVDFAHVALDVTAHHGLVSTQVIALENLAMVSFHAGRSRSRPASPGGVRCVPGPHTIRMAVPPDPGAPRTQVIPRSPDELAVQAESLTIDDAVVYARRHRGARGRPITGSDALTPAEAGGRARRRWSVQPGGRRLALRQPGDGQDPPHPCVPEARAPHSHPTRRRRAHP